MKLVQNICIFFDFADAEHLVWAPSKFGHPSGSCGEDPIRTIDLLLFFVVVDNYLPTNQPTYLPTSLKENSLMQNILMGENCN